MHALSSGALASRARRAGRRWCGCQQLHLDMPAWSATASATARNWPTSWPQPTHPRWRSAPPAGLLLKVMTTPGVPAALALHGRVGGLAAVPAPVITPAELSRGWTAARRPVPARSAVHYPGIELICSASLSLNSDPYLADYRIDGMPCCRPYSRSRRWRRPHRCSLASRCGGFRGDAGVAGAHPTGGEADLRICALRDGDRIIAVLRCADSSYRVDHARAEFSSRATPELPAAQSPRHRSGVATSFVAGQSGLVDGAELYGPI